MAKKSTWVVLVAFAAVLGVGFWLGRVSSDSSGGDGASAEVSTRSTTRAPRRYAARVARPGAGRGAIVSAADLRGIFKGSGSNMQRGLAAAKQALAAMNGPEVSRLVRDLAATQAASPGYSYRLEIETACGRWAQLDPGAALSFALANRQKTFRHYALSSIFSGLAEIDPVYAKQMLGKIDDPSMRRSLKTKITAAMAVTHPDAWLDEVKNNPSMSGYIISAVSEWAMDDPAATAVRIKQMPPSMQRSAIATLAAIWAGKDRAGAIAWVGSLENAASREKAMSAVAGGVAAEDPDAAFSLLAGLGAAGRRAGIAAIFQTLADRDFDGAMDRALALPGEKDQASAVRALIGIGSDPFGSYSGYMAGLAGNAEQVHKLAQRLPAGRLRNQAVTALAQRLAFYPLADAEKILIDYTEKERGKMKMQMMNSCLSSDPERALEIYQSAPEDGSMAAYLPNILSRLAHKNPQAALDLALQTSDIRSAKSGVSSAFARLCAYDTASALRKLDTLPEGELKQSGVLAIAHSWSRQDAAAAMKWAEDLDSPERVQAMCSVMGNMLTSDPEAVARGLDKLLNNAEPKDLRQLSNTARNLMSAWGENDPSSAAAWASRVSDPQSQTAAVASLTYQWLKTDQESAATWVETLPDGKARDAGVTQMVSATREKDPATSFAWANSLSNAQARYSQISYTLRSWKKNDPVKARAAVRQADVTESQRENLLKSLDR